LHFWRTKGIEDPYLIRTPVVRNGRQATVGYCPEVWKDWK
jgi:arsenate reductase-like glutaredoxin family protein